MLISARFPRFSPQIRTLSAYKGLQGDCVISCRNKKLNHHLNTRYDKFQEIPLVSKGWHHRKSIGDFFKIHPVSKRYQEEDFVPFESIGIQECFIEGLKEAGVVKATPFQAKAVPLIAEKEHVLLAAETGCGKTISYLLPIFQAVLKSKSEEANLNRPRGLILTPNRELAYQIGDVAEKLAKHANMTVKVLVGGHTKKIMNNPSVEPVDILIATPGVVGKLSTLGIYRLDQVEFTVLDEADTLLDDSFEERMTSIINRLPSSKFALVSATLPKNLPDVLKPIEPHLTRVISDNVHKPLTNIAQKFMRQTRANKPAFLIELAKTNRKPMLVFTNRNKTCDWLAMFLRENGVNCSNINGDMHYDIRVQEWNKFVGGENLVLSSTDVGSRGLDTTEVQHVINYDFPVYAADYLHRVGRVGRLGSVSGCKVTNFVSGPEEIALVQQIELAVRRNEPLQNVDGNITNIVQRKIEKGIRQAL